MSKSNLFGPSLVTVTSCFEVTFQSGGTRSRETMLVPPGPGGTNIISKELVPRDWNSASKQEVTVTKDGPNKFDFDIP